MYSSACVAGKIIENKLWRCRIVFHVAWQSNEIKRRNMSYEPCPYLSINTAIWSRILRWAIFPLALSDRVCVCGDAYSMSRMSQRAQRAADSKKNIEEEWNKQNKSDLAGDIASRLSTWRTHIYHRKRIGGGWGEEKEKGAHFEMLYK